MSHNDCSTIGKIYKAYIRAIQFWDVRVEKVRKELPANHNVNEYI